MQFKKSLSVLALTATLVMATVAAAPAEGLSGAYLAARKASADYDFRAASLYFTRALVRDPANPQLMENAILAFIGTGDVERTLPIARRLHGINPKAQIANMLLLSEAVQTDSFQQAFDLLAQGETVGPLVDGLVQAWVQIGLGRMGEALDGFDKVSKEPGLLTFGLYHKALALAMVGDLEAADDNLSGRSGTALPATRRGAAFR